jgi:glyceraldehyde 3-phosphate dehydrogenase
MSAVGPLLRRLTESGGDLVKVFGWYDNEWGYANRLVEMAQRMA